MIRNLRKVVETFLKLDAGYIENNKDKLVEFMHEIDAEIITSDYIVRMNWIELRREVKAKLNELSR